MDCPITYMKHLVYSKARYKCCHCCTSAHSNAVSQSQHLRQAAARQAKPTLYVALLYRHYCNRILLAIDTLWHYSDAGAVVLHSEYLFDKQQLLPLGTFWQECVCSAMASICLHTTLSLVIFASVVCHSAAKQMVQISSVIHILGY